MKVEKKYKRILAIDPGDEWIGVAHTDPLQQLAFPYATWKRSELIEKLREYLHFNSITCMVIGYPITMGNKISEETEKAIKLKIKLEKKFPDISFVFQDERLTSKYATEIKKLGFGGGNSDHSLAAATILDLYLAKKNKNT